MRKMLWDKQWFQLTWVKWVKWVKNCPLCIMEAEAHYGSFIETVENRLVNFVIASGSFSCILLLIAMLNLQTTQ